MELSSPPLLHLDVDITRKCNWECIHCSAQGGINIDVSNELTNEEILSILKQGKSLGVKDVGFTGGEPLLRSDDLLHFLRYCKEKLGVKTHLLTNGSLIQKTRNIREIVRYTDRVRVTLLGFKETHNKLTRTLGAYEATITGIKILKDSGANLQVAFVPMKQNYKELPSLIKTLYENYRVSKFRLLDLMPTGRAMENWKDISLNHDEKKWLDEEIEKVSLTHDIDISAGFHTSLTFSSPKKLRGHEFCTSGLNRCHINAIGEVFPCTASTGQPILSGGNLRSFNLDLKYIWETAPIFQCLRYFRKHPPKPCDTCEKYSFCAGGCRVKINYMYGKITMPNPECETVKSYMRELKEVSRE